MSMETGESLGEQPGPGVARSARAAGLNRLRLSHAGFAWR